MTRDSLRLVYLQGELAFLEGYVSRAVERLEVRDEILRMLRRIRSLALGGSVAPGGSGVEG